MGRHLLELTTGRLIVSHVSTVLHIFPRGSGFAIDSPPLNLDCGSMQTFKDSVRRFLVSEDGPTAVEYAVMGGFIIAAIVGTISGVGQATLALYVKSYSAMP